MEDSTIHQYNWLAKFFHWFTFLILIIQIPLGFILVRLDFSDLRITIENKYKGAIRSKNIPEINTLRLIKSAIKDKDIDARSKGNIKGIEVLILLDLF